ncbi:MAG: hypothetical protein ACRD3W_26630, partial [Terriglobales bacterium]
MSEHETPQAGPALDRRVHEHVVQAHYTEGDDPHLETEPYSTDVDAALRLLRLLTSAGWSVSINPIYDDVSKELHWTCSLTAEPDTGSPSFAAHPRKIAHVLCLAALREKPFSATCVTLP